MRRGLAYIDKLNKRWLVHLLFWIVISVFYYFNYQRISEKYALAFVLKDDIVIISLFYIFGYFIVPRYVLKAKFIHLVAWFLFCYIFYAVMTYWCCKILYLQTDHDAYLDRYLSFLVNGGISSLFSWSKFPVLILDFCYLVMLPFGLKLMKELLNKSHEKTLLERDNLRLELDFLKSQLNPHFLFNSLNTISGMVEKGHPYTNDAIGQLGNLLRFTLYDTATETIPIRREIDFMQDYIDFQHLRFGEKAHVEARFNIAYPEQPVVPLIFSPLLENAYKHGVELSKKDAWIKISIDLNVNGLLIIHLSNSCYASSRQKKEDGIGLENIKRRLESFYKNRYTLEVNKSEEVFEINLTIQLKRDSV